jgi:putative transposase
MVSPEHKRRAVAAVLETGLCTLRRACRYLGLGRSSYFYRAKEREPEAVLLVKRIREISLAEPTYGYRFVTAELIKEGWRVNRKKVQRIRRAEGLVAVQPKRKSSRRGNSTVSEKIEAKEPNDVWTWDFIHDRTEDGRTIKIFSLIDEHSRYCLALKVENKINAKAVRQALEQASAAFGLPRHIRSDNGPVTEERSDDIAQRPFIADIIRQWITEQKIQTLYIDPGCPWQNPYVESFHSRFRNDCLNRELFLNLLDAQVAIGDWRTKYNHRRPHSGIGYRSPVEVFHAHTPTAAKTTAHMGALPPNPRDFSHYGMPAGSVLKTVESMKLSARRICTAAGARVASLQSPILRDSLTIPDHSLLQFNPIT